MSSSTPPHQRDSVSADASGIIVRRRQWPGVIALVLIAGLLTWTAGLRGVLAGGVLVGIGLTAPAPVAFGVGVCSLLLTPLNPLLALVCLLLLGSILVAPARETPYQWALFSGTIFAGLVCGSITLWLVNSWPLLWVGITVLCGSGGIVYLIHRYEQVTLGLVTDSTTQ